MTAGGAAITAAFPNMPKFLDNPDNADSQVVGKLASGMPPGRIIDGKLIRRSLWWPNVTFGVSSQSDTPEAAYLFLQWANSPSIFTWMVGNPAGYFDPFQLSDWEDPLVVANYKEYHIPTLVNSIERAVPPILMNGTGEYETALDKELQAVMAGTKTAKRLWPMLPQNGRRSLIASAAKSRSRPCRAWKQVSQPLLTRQRSNN